MSNSVSVVGIGRLGLCTALCFARRGYRVVGVDIDAGYVASLNDKTFRSNEPSVNELLTSVSTFRATTDIGEAIENSDFIYVLVDTPTVGEVSYDTSKLEKVLSSLNGRKISRKHVIIGCTVMPGYTENVAPTFLSDTREVSISYNPEFIKQGSIVEDFTHPDMILIGEGCREAGDFMESLLREVSSGDPSVCRMSPTSAEICKLSINCFVTAKISYANMVGDIADLTPGADKKAILSAISKDKRVGERCMSWGYGFGGPCFPRDNRALSAHASSVGMTAHLSLCTDKMNEEHAIRQAKVLIDAGDHVTFEDVAYKPGCLVDIIENSQKLRVARLAAEKGVGVTVRDRRGILDLVRSEYGDLFEYEEM